MSTYKPYKPIDPDSLLTRADFVIELLNMWTETLEIIARNPSGTAEELGTKGELEAAIYVLKRSFPTSELMSVDAYAYFKTAVDKMELIQTRYDHDCFLIMHDPTLTGVGKVELLERREKARDEELLNLDRRDDSAC